VVEPIFTRARIDGFGFDVEILAIASHLGFRIVEVPVRWRNDADSRVSFVQGAAAFFDPLRVRLGLWLGRHGGRRLKRLSGRSTRRPVGCCSAQGAVGLHSAPASS
jgi:dolichyl-phosphate beta-glucosyltransferase